MKCHSGVICGDGAGGSPEESGVNEGGSGTPSAAGGPKLGAPGEDLACFRIPGNGILPQDLQKGL